MGTPAARLADEAILAAVMGSEAGRTRLLRACVVDGTGDGPIVGPLTNSPWCSSGVCTRPMCTPRSGGCSGMQYTLKQAAAAVGRNKTTLLRAVKTGRLSADR